MNEKEFDNIWRTLHQSLYLYALSLTRDPQDAEDLVMDAMLKAYLSYDGKENIHAWMYKVLKNRFVDKCRKEKHIVHPEAHILENIADPGEESRRILKTGEERKLWLYRKVYALPQKERDVILLTVNSGLKDKEIAGLIGVSVSNLRVIRHRTIEKLKLQAKEEDEDE